MVPSTTFPSVGLLLEILIFSGRMAAREFWPTENAKSLGDAVRFPRGPASILTLSSWTFYTRASKKFMVPIEQLTAEANSLDGIGD
jgi:hypothetical protein